MGKTVAIPTQALSATIAAAHSSIERISELAARFDERFRLSSSVHKAVSIPREKCSAALSEVSQCAAALSAAANAQLQSVQQGICSRAVAIANVGANMLFSTAAALDGRFAIEATAISTGAKVVDRASRFDEKYNVKDKVSALATGVILRAGNFDEKVTGGRLTTVVVTAYERSCAVTNDGVAYVQTAYGSAKQQRQSLLAPMPEDMKDGVQEVSQEDGKVDINEAAAGSSSTIATEVGTVANEPGDVAMEDAVKLTWF